MTTAPDPHAKLPFALSQQDLYVFRSGGRLTVGRFDSFCQNGSVAMYDLVRGTRVFVPRAELVPDLTLAACFLADAEALRKAHAQTAARLKKFERANAPRKKTPRRTR